LIGVTWCLPGLCL